MLRKDGKFVDEDFAKWCCEHNMKWGDSNFFISDNVTSLSNCCFSGDTKVLVKSHSKVYLDTFKNLSSPEYASARRDMTVFHNGSWMAAKLIKLPKRQMYKVTTSNNKEIVVTDNHIHPTLQGDKATTDLTTDDYIMFNCRTLDTYPECDRKLTYEQGFLIGMYLGDGSISKSVVNLSLNAEKYSKSIDIINRALRDYKIEATPRLGNEYNKVYPVTITSNALVDAIREWVGGAYANVKTLNLDCLTQSRAFRGGILDGYYLTDGGNSNRIYTTSKKLAEQIEALCTSLGKHTIIDMSDRTNEPVVIRGSVYKRNYPLYCIRWYEDVNKRTYKNIYEVRNNSTYFKVTSIEPVKYDDEFVYCFEMQRDIEPYFTLPNGMITHNCRLVSDIDNLGYFNSIGGTALEVGSVKVNTVNLARIAYESKDEDEYIEILKDRVNTCLTALDVVRHIIQRNIEKGLLPNYSHKLINMKSQYNTCGIIGIFETLQHFGMTSVDQFGNTSYTDEGVEFAKKILKTINDVKDEFAKNTDYQINVEQIPGERAAYILEQKDQIFYPNEKYDLPLMGNQWIPLGVKTTLEEKVKLSAILDKACNAGSIAHINLDAPLTNFDTAWKLLNYVADAGVVYFAFNLRISACANNHGFYGDVCPICGGKKVTTYQRIVGFLTPESTYSKERKAEFAMRDWIDVNAMEEL